MNKPASERILSVAALGRPFRLGMLYDSRTEQIIPGITLWDQSTLEARTVQQQETSDFHLITSDSLDDKTSALEVNAGLKLSFLGGLIDVQGSAKYLDNRKSSNHQERVTLQYKCTTKAEALTMEQLGKGRLQHPDVFDHGTATHVVTSILYGAQAFFIFDKQHSSSALERKVDGNLHVLIKKIPCMKIEGSGQLDLTENEKHKTEQLTCRFFGDFLLRQNPSSFPEAVKISQELPQLLGKTGENAVPVKVELYPLTLLDSKASKLVREISVNLVSETENLLEEMQEVNVKCNDLAKSVISTFPEIQHEISEYRNLCETYKRGVQKDLSDLLPKIRGGGEEEQTLAELLQKNNQSPFSSHALRSWLRTKETQVKVLNEYSRALSEITFVAEPGDLESFVLSPDNIFILCLTIILPKNDSQLKNMKDYLDTNRGQSSVSKSAGGEVVPSQDIHETSLMEMARVFRDFFNASSKRKGVLFLVSQEFSDSGNFRAQVRCYQHGALTTRNYDLPSAPERPEAIVKDSTHDTVTVSWGPPRYGKSAVTSYVASYREMGTQHDFLSISTTASDELQVTLSGLAANTEYEVRVCARCEVGDGPSSEVAGSVRTRPTSPPRMLQASKVSPKKVLLQWEAPETVGAGCSIKEYIIQQRDPESVHWRECARTSSSHPSCKLGVAPNTLLSFTVTACCGTAGLSRSTEPTSISAEMPNTSEELKKRICGASRLLQEGSPCIYKPELQLVVARPNDMIEKYEFGKRMYNTTEKIIMLVGATGSGKTTLINGLVNFIFGVEWNDPFRFKLIVESEAGNQAMSQTKAITSYTIHHQQGFRVPYTVTIIDTPGFGDVSGIMRDKQITEQIRNFFTTRGVGGITHIDAVGFVAQSSLPRLTPTQRYIFDQILSLFGKDIKDNIFLLLTFADGQQPQVLSGVKEANIPYRKHFKFNNSALFANQSAKNTKGAESDTDSDEGDGYGNFDSMFWDMGLRSFKLFLKQLGSVESRSLILTQDVLNERNILEVSVEGIQRDIQEGLSTLERLSKEIDMLKTHQADIDRNKDFEYEVEEEIHEQIPTPVGQHVTNCLNCNRTCHKVCAIADNEKKYYCWAMTNGNCRICPQKCVWSLHKNYPYTYELKVVKKKKTVEELRQRYEEATKKKLSTEGLIDQVNDEFEALQVKVLGMTEAVRKSLQRLREIALKPNPLSTVEYIDIMVESEKSQAQPGWQARVKQLTRVRKEAEYMQQVADRGFDPFKQHREKIILKAKQTKAPFWRRALEFFQSK